MSELRERDWSLTFGNTQIRPSIDGELHIDFEVEKSLKREPNKATIRIYNLSEQRRTAITSDTQVVLSAGYLGMTDVIFAGQARVASHALENTDWTTTIEAEDSGASYSSARIQKNYGANTPFLTVLRDVVDAMGIGLGNASTLGSALDRDNGPTTFVEGYTVSGPAWRVLDQLVRSRGLQWSVQSGVLQLKRNGRPVDTRSYRLAPETGLVGGAKVDLVTERRTVKKKVSVVAHLVPGLNPGRVVVLESVNASGSYEIQRVRYTGATYSNDWNAELTLEEY